MGVVGHTVIIDDTPTTGNTDDLGHTRDTGDLGTIGHTGNAVATLDVAGKGDHAARADNTDYWLC